MKTIELCVIKGTQGGTLKLVWGRSHQPFHASRLYNSFIHFVNINNYG